MRDVIDLPGLDFIPGAAIPQGSVGVLHGLRGAGKTTLCVALAAAAVKAGTAVECALAETTRADHEQLVRSMGLGADGIRLTEVQSLAALAPPADCGLWIVDGLSALSPMRSQRAQAGLVSLLKTCRRREITTLFVVHATKSGTAAGPALLQHLVDFVWRLIVCGKHHILRVEKLRRIGRWATLGRPRDQTLLLTSTGFCPTPHADPTVASAVGFAGGQLANVQAPVSLPAGRLHCPFLPARRMRQLLATLEQHAGVSVDADHVGVSLLAPAVAGERQVRQVIGSAMLSRNHVLDLVLDKRSIALAYAAVLAAVARTPSHRVTHRGGSPAASCGLEHPTRLGLQNGDHVERFDVRVVGRLVTRGQAPLGVLLGQAIQPRLRPRVCPQRGNACCHFRRGAFTDGIEQLVQRPVFNAGCHTSIIALGPVREQSRPQRRS